MDDLDRRILQVLQRDASLSVEKIASEVGSSKSPVWARIKKLKDSGVISKEVALLDPEKIGQTEVFFIAVKTDQHEENWLERFSDAVQDMPEIQEAHRLAGEIDYLLKVRVENTRAFDAFYKRLVARVRLFAVTSSLSMETLKSTTQMQV
ncbi:Lrp/AsnC family transcriptional regulator [Ahrensia marina]|uniref:Lrp/AsnC family transcriptional regulator n=1 Tax=Ahrensia marina TaxID=1514904 RepID=UPI0035CFE461